MYLTFQNYRIVRNKNGWNRHVFPFRFTSLVFSLPAQNMSDSRPVAAPYGWQTSLDRLCTKTSPLPPGLMNSFAHKNTFLLVNIKPTLLPLFPRLRHCLVSLQYRFPLNCLRIKSSRHQYSLEIKDWSRYILFLDDSVCLSESSANTHRDKCYFWEAVDIDKSYYCHYFIPTTVSSPLVK